MTAKPKSLSNLGADRAEFGTVYTQLLAKKSKLYSNNFVYIIILIKYFYCNI